jgi:tetratricopeptide (TPR) repeat protein
MGGFFNVSALAQQQPEVWNAPPLGKISAIPKPVNDAMDRVQLRDAPRDASAKQKSSADDATCLLPPLTLVQSPTVAAAHLQTPAKAKKEYEEACAALKDKKTENLEKHLRKAVQEYPKYSAAWVTLGQVLAARQQNDEARSACSQGSAADPSYVPAYLCLADIAAREKAWDEVLKLSSRALELDPTVNAVAYEYNAAANLRVNRLAEAEKSALKALEIDKNNTEPRAHFVLAQIYEAKGDRENEAAQLQEYLKFASDPQDVAMVKQYLSQLEADK